MDNEIILSNGVFTASLTPLNADLSVNYNALIEHCQWLLQNGSDGIALLGTTGEANSFTMEERIEMIEKVVKAGIPAERLMVGTGCCAYTDTIELTKFAVSQRIGGILLLPPFYYKQVDDEGLAKYFDLVINGVQSDQLKIYLYHFPKMSGVGFSAGLLDHLIKEYPRQIVGMKDSSGDFEHMKSVLEAHPGFKLYAGTEKLLLDILKIGGAGCISATANVTTALAGRVYQAWKSDEAAEDLQSYLSKVRSSFEGLPFTGALKAYLATQDSEDAWLSVRPPNRLINQDKLKDLSDRLKELQFI